MSMITGCPACGTLFKVVPDQLKISDGWVRCGHCSEVFDAAAHMRQLVDADEEQSAPDAAFTMTAPLTGDPPRPMAAPAPAVLPFPAPPPRAEAPPPVSVLPSFYPDDAIEVREGSPSQLETESVAGPTLLRRPDAGWPAPGDSVRAGLESSRPRIDMVDDDDDGDGPRSIYDPSLDQVTFVRAARRKAFWRRRGVRLAQVLLALLLSAALGVQLVVQERDRLAALYPEWRPVLQSVCDVAGCKVGPHKRIESVVIDSSGFTRLRQDAYRLSVTIKNLAPQPVAMPWLELTLTDSQDQPLLRKVVQARELGRAPESLAPNSEWSASATIALSGGPDTARVAGYRLLAFYP